MSLSREQIQRNQLQKLQSQAVDLSPQGLLRAKMQEVVKRAYAPDIEPTTGVKLHPHANRSVQEHHSPILFNQPATAKAHAKRERRKERNRELLDRQRSK